MIAERLGLLFSFCGTELTALPPDRHTTQTLQAAYLSKVSSNCYVQVSGRRGNIEFHAKNEEGT